MRAVSVVQNLLFQQRQEKASDTTDEEAFTGLRDEIEKRYSSAEEFYEKTWLSEGIIWTLDDRQGSRPRTRQSQRATRYRNSW